MKSHNYKNILEIIDEVDAGDSYDYSTDSKIPVISNSRKCNIQDLNICGRIARYKLEMQIPKNINERAKKKHTSKLKISVSLELSAIKPVLNVKFTIQNTAVDHRLRVLVPTDIPSINSYADQTFGTICRPTYLPSIKNWKESKWSEKPRTIEPMQSLVYLKGKNRIVELITDSVKEYQIIGDKKDTIAYTLFRSYCQMGRKDLEDRPGRESGKEWLTPDSMLLKEMNFTFAIAFPQSVQKCVDYSNEFTTPMRAYQEAIVSTNEDEFILGSKSEILPPRFSAFKVKNGNSKLSIYKLGERNGMVARFSMIQSGSINIETSKKIEYTNLIEFKHERFKEKRFPKNKIITIKMEEK